MNNQKKLDENSLIYDEYKRYKLSKEIISHIYVNGPFLFFNIESIDLDIEKSMFCLFDKKTKRLIKLSVTIIQNKIAIDLKNLSDEIFGNWEVVYVNREKKTIHFLYTSKKEVLTKRDFVIGRLLDNNSLSVVSYINLNNYQLNLYINTEQGILNKFPIPGYDIKDKENITLKTENINVQSLETENNFLVLKVSKELEGKIKSLFVKKRKEEQKFYLSYFEEEKSSQLILKINLEQLFLYFNKSTRLDLYLEENTEDFIFERKFTFYFRNQEEKKQPYQKIIAIDGNFGLVPYVTKNQDISIFMSEKSKLISDSFSGKVVLKKISKNKNGVINGEIELQTDEFFEAKSIIVKLRKSENGENFIIPITKKKSLNKFDFSLDLKNYEFSQFYWDFFLVINNKQSQEVHLRVKNDSLKIKMALQLFEKKYSYYYPDSEYKVYPYITASEEFSLNYRLHGEYEDPKYKRNEKIAYLLYLIMGLFYKRDKKWLIHEKFSNTAQDNSFYFFKYCYEKHHEKKVYYVIKKDSDDLKYLKPYEDRVIYFMSIKHLLYLLTCNKIVSSEAKGHGYAWRVSSGLIKPVMNRKHYIFLQHGVLGLKQIDNTFKAHGVNHADLFIASSDFEKGIIMKHFGYKDSEVLVSGLARWDNFKQRKNYFKQEIFFMPTWRNWLEEVSDDVFLQSEYFKEYSEFLQSDALSNILNKKEVNLNFYLHPKFMPFTKYFESLDKRINIVGFGEKTINELVYDCSLLITDYSSVAWEAYYQDKTVLFYQFDREKYEQLQGSYMNLETDLFGECAFNAKELIEKIDKLITFEFSNFNNEKYLEDKKHYFKYVDKDNSKRIYHGILETEENNSLKNEIIFSLKSNIYFRTIWRRIKTIKIIKILKSYLMD